jgi:hypothetical protein
VSQAKKRRTSPCPIDVFQVQLRIFITLDHVENVSFTNKINKRNRHAFIVQRCQRCDRRAVHATYKSSQTKLYSQNLTEAPALFNHPGYEASGLEVFLYSVFWITTVVDLIIQRGAR